MPRSRGVVVVGLLALAVLCLVTMKGQVSLTQAGQRAGVLLALLVVVDRVLLPLARSVVGPPARGSESAH